jgi:hypothetical protein
MRLMVDFVRGSAPLPAYGNAVLQWPLSPAP